MAFGSQLDVEFEDGENVDTRIIRKKISSLKSAFMSKHFTEVEELLVCMVEKLKHEVMSFKKEKELIEERAQIQRLEKLKTESELRECRRECLQLKKERDGFDETVKSIAEDKRIMRELKEENCDLKGEKLKMETEIDFYKRKFEDLGMMFLLLEKDVMLKSDGPTSNVGVPGEAVGEKGAVNEKVKSGENAVKVNTKMVATDCNGNVVIEANGVPSCHSLKNGNGDAGATGFCAAVSGEGLVEKGVSENEKGSGGIDNLKAKMIVVDSYGNMVSGSIEASCSNSLENGDGNVGGAPGGGTPQLKEIVEIVDSDDDSSLCAILSRKELAMKGCEDEADIDQEVVENETKLLKRKRASSSNSKDGDAGSNEHKATKCKGLIEGPDSLPVDHCSETTMLSRQGPASTQIEEKITAERYSQNQWNKVVLDWLALDSDSEESSSSSDWEDLDFSTDFSAMTKL